MKKYILAVFIIGLSIVELKADCGGGELHFRIKDQQPGYHLFSLTHFPYRIKVIAENNITMVSSCPHRLRWEHNFNLVPNVCVGNIN
jgi:hypothetical protein